MSYRWDLRVGLLMTLQFLTLYPIERETCTIWNVCENTFRYRVRHVLDLLYVHSNYIPGCSARFQQPLPTDDSFFFNTFSIVDCTECLIFRSTDDATQRMFYSGKKKTHTLKYEVVVRICDGMIIWVNG